MLEAPLADVWAWWTDFGEVGVTHRVGHGTLPSRRTVLHKAGREVVIEDRWGLFAARRKLEIGDHVIVERNRGFRATWRFEAVGSRTRVSREVETSGPRFTHAVSRRLLQRDLEFHCREAERDLRAA